MDSHKQARIIVEPTELSPTDPNSEVQAKALELADAIEEAHQLMLNRASDTDLKDAFNAAEIKRLELDTILKNGQRGQILPENKPVTLLIYERELARNERTVMRTKISEMLESGQLSLTDLETKKAHQIFSATEHAEITLEAGERTRENLEPVELSARHSDVSEVLQKAALGASAALERAHQIYHQADAGEKETSRVFSELDTSIISLKNERRADRSIAKITNFKIGFKRDLAKLFEHRESFENPQIIASMTKGLLIDGMEKQNGSVDKIGTERLSEISLTIALAISGGAQRGQSAGKNFESNQKSEASERSERNNLISRQTDQEQQHAQVKQKQFERVR